MRRALALLVLIVVTTTGCSVSVNTGKGAEAGHRPTAPTNAVGVEVWDLRSPPTVEDVKMPDGQDYVGYSTRTARPILVRLPEGHELSIDATLVTFDNLPGPSAAPGKTPRAPTGMDFRTAVLDLDDATKVLRRSISALGVEDPSTQKWLREIDQRPRSGASADLPIQGGGGGVDLGYLNIGVGASYDPMSDRAIVKFRANWGTARDPG